MKRYFKKVQLTEYYIITAGNNKASDNCGCGDNFSIHNEYSPVWKSQLGG